MQHTTALPNCSNLVPYFQVFHYSSEHDLNTIDPRFFGTSLLRTKDKEGGLDKSYFYTIDQPESCVASGLKQRYVIYIPLSWKNLIYDIGLDPCNFYEKARQELRELVKNEFREPYLYEINNYLQLTLKQSGYKGFTNSLSTLPHVITVFYSMPTKKPVGPTIIYDWSESVIEKNEWAIIPLSLHNRFFPLLKQSTTLLPEQSTLRKLTPTQM